MKHAEAGCAALALAAALSGSAATAAERAAPSPVAAHGDTCVFGYGRPVACRVAASATRDGTVVLTFRAQGRTVVFRGRSQSGWWSGRLNDAPAMGYELNRGHTVYSTVDLKTVFEHWSPGLQHGSY